MDSRQDRINRAQELIAEHRDWGKDRIGQALKAEFGVSLDHNLIVKLRQEVSAPSRERQRYSRLLSEGFLPSEAQVLSRKRITSPAMRAYRGERQRIVKKATQLGISKQQLRDQIKNLYALEGHAPRERVSPLARYRQMLDTWGLSERPTRRFPLTEQGVYNRLRQSGFLHEEAQELAQARGSTNAIDTEPWQRAMASRRQWVTMVANRLRGQGWSQRQIKTFIRQQLLDYLKQPGASPWDFIRQEYKPKRKVQDFVMAAGRRKQVSQARRRTGRLKLAYSVGSPV